MNSFSLISCCFVVFLLISVCCCSLQKAPNTCKTFDDYYRMKNNPNCWYTDDINLETEEYAKRLRLPLESYTVTTQDGYILKMFRIPRRQQRRGVIFLQHPATTCSSIWLDKGNKSLGFMLYNAGYDVWLPNFRGNKYSRRHVKLDPNKPEFWDHSFHEMALYDTPAQLDVVQKMTKVGNEITYIGHSLGGTVAALYPTLLPEKAASQLKASIAVAPAIQFKTINAQVAKLVSGNAETILSLMTAMNQLEIFSPTIGPIFKNFCVNYHAGIEFCANFFNWLMGVSIDQMVPEFYPKIFSQSPSGISIKVFVHFLQCHRSKRFQYYDYGKEINKQKYNNSIIPPLYPIENIKVPMYFISGERDALCPFEDNQEIYQRINEKYRKEHVIFKQHNHLDFMYGKHFYSFHKYLIKTLNNKIYGRNYKKA